ncbi:MAG: hypothetical protein GF313_04855 [Caldithrix sp.]|nr:hypothetical protein [Caldithrix sp.]
MEAIKRNYIVDENNNTIAVQLDIETFNKIEKALKDFALYNLISENDEDETLNLDDVRDFYNPLKKTS